VTMYKVDISYDAPTDVRLLSPFFLDEEWKNVFAARVLEEGHVPHEIEPDDIEFVHEKDDGQDKFYIELDVIEKKEHEAIASALPMLIIQTEVTSTSTMSDGESLGAMLLDSGMAPAEIDHIMGSPENWRTNTTLAAEYETLRQ